MITSVKNPKVKELRLLQAQTKARRAAGTFVVEGIRLAEEALAADWQTTYCLYSPGITTRGMEIVQKLQEAGVETEAAADHVISAASDTRSPQGLLLVVRMDRFRLPETPSLVLVLDQIQDPGNQGSLLRTAAAAAFEAVLMTEGSSDVFAPKVLRAGMGAHFHLPIMTLPPEEIAGYCRQHNLTMWAAMLRQGEDYTRADLRAPTALIIGSEAHGVGAALAGHARPIQIPMPGSSESLNASTAGAILMFEAVRQRTAVQG